jgi:hypothetical protein
MRQPKTGRRANEDEREHARVWVDIYRQAQDQPGGTLCLNPDAPSEEQTWIDGNDPEHLLRMLKAFAEHGTFEFVGELADSVRLLPLRMEYKKAIISGTTRAQAIVELAEKYHRSTRAIERYVSDKS